MIEMLMSVALAFGISFYALPAIIHLTIEKGLYDFPDDRKVHHNPVPSLGGLAIYAGFIIAFLLSVVFTGERFVFQYFVAASLIMFFIGLKDDLLNLAAFKKFLGQIMAAALLVFKGGLVITSMGGVLGIYDLQPVAGQILSVVTIVVIINAYNLIDGIDGLAGSLTFLSTLIFAVFFAINGDWSYACMATSLLGSVGAFLIFNYPPARIFMGDTGSLLVGLVNAVMVIHFIQTAGSAPVFSIAAPAAVGFAILFVPLFDTLRVFSYRIVHGISPFTPDRNHVHHILLRFGWSHLKISIFLSVASLLAVVSAYSIQELGTTIVLLFLNGMGFLMIGGTLFLYKKRRRTLFTEAFPRIEPKEKKVPIIPVATKRAAN